MELMGVCNICGTAAKLYSCMLCGRMVCSEHFDARKGVCVVCLRGRKY